LNLKTIAGGQKTRKEKKMLIVNEPSEKAEGIEKKPEEAPVYLNSIHGLRNEKEVSSNRIEFDVWPTANHEEAIGHARNVVNVRTGIGIERLFSVIREHVPHAKNSGAYTKKIIIRTERYECPCCPTILQALVDVKCCGVHSEKWDEIEGLYLVTICEDKTIVAKMKQDIIWQGQTEALPKKDYNNPKAKKEIAGRSKMFAGAIGKDDEQKKEAIENLFNTASSIKLE